MVRVNVKQTGILTLYCYKHKIEEEVSNTVYDDYIHLGQNILFSNRILMENKPLPGYRCDGHMEYRYWKMWNHLRFERKMIKKLQKIKF